MPVRTICKLWTLRATVVDAKIQILFGGFSCVFAGLIVLDNWPNLSHFPCLVFEYDGFSGESPVNLFIEENLLQHRAPLPRMRAEPKSLRPKTTTLLHESKKTSQGTKPKEAEPTSDSHNDILGTIGNTTVDVPAEVQSNTSVTYEPSRGSETTPQAIQSVTAGISQWPFPLPAEPATTSSSVTFTETTRATKNPTQPSESQATMRYIPATMMETSTQGVKYQMQTIPAETSALSSKPATNPATEASTTAPTSTMTITTHAVPSSAPTPPPAAPTTATTTQAATTTPEELTESLPTNSPFTWFSHTSLPPTAPETTSLAPTTPNPPTTTTTKQAVQMKWQHRVSWDEGKGESDEPMQRQEESPSRKSSKLTSNVE